MTGGNAIRGSRVGAGPMGEAERGDAAPRVRVSFFCTQGHQSIPSFSVDAVIPDLWDCVHCGFPASQDREHPPPAPRNEPFKTHLAYVKERRSAEEGDSILNEALNALRERRTL